MPAKDKMKTCCTCRVPKKLDEFHKCANSSDGHMYECKPCSKIRRTERHLRSRYDDLVRRRFYLYGITKDQYEDLLVKQNGVCAICLSLDLKKTLCVDHDHQTGRIRGLLCSKCNKGLGLFGDTRDLLLKAVKYLEG